MSGQGWQAFLAAEGVEDWVVLHGGARSLAQEVQLAIAAQPDAIDVGFWRAVLGYAELADDNAVDPLATNPRSGCRASTRPSPCVTRCTSTYPSPAKRPSGA
jgi:hypothetical protein